jgi:phytanoyl-CoA hydroxylase
MSEPVTYRLTPVEQAHYDERGYVVRTGVFDAAEVGVMAEACEQLIDQLVRDRDGHRLHVGSYVFDPDLLRGVIIKWEGESDAVHGIEPLAHLAPALEEVALDDRLVEPMRSILGHDDLELFTEKLNLKRPHHGGPNPPHQDYPYWLDPADDPTEVATTILYLDDATVENGCTWVAPASHRSGMWQTRDDLGEFGKNEIDVTAYPDLDLVPVEVPAGSTVSFGSFLVHQSTPNRSDEGRRALLFSYQPAGRPKMIDQLRKLAGTSG